MKNPNISNNLVVSVCMISYNHEQFIERAIEGVLSQRCNFNFELLISDDFSKDNTKDICLKFQKKYPDKIKLQLNESNVGMMDNFIQALNLCEGKYIALCEGDDYWIDPLKLQKQIDFLESNPNFSMCFTNSITKDELTSEEKIAKVNIWDVCDTRQMLKHNSIEGELYGEIINSPGHTSTFVFRNHLFNKFPVWYKTCYTGDEPLFLILSKFGNAKFINDITSIYRVHPKGNSSLSFSFEKDSIERIKMYKNLNIFFNKDHKKYIHELIAKYYFKLIKLNLNNKKYFKSNFLLFLILYYDYKVFLNKLFK